MGYYTIAGAGVRGAAGMPSWMAVAARRNTAGRRRPVEVEHGHVGMSRYEKTSFYPNDDFLLGI